MAGLTQDTLYLAGIGKPPELDATDKRNEDNMQSSRASRASPRQDIKLGKGAQNLASTLDVK